MALRSLKGKGESKQVARQHKAPAKRVRAPPLPCSPSPSVLRSPKERREGRKERRREKKQVRGDFQRRPKSFRSYFPRTLDIIFYCRFLNLWANLPMFRALLLLLNPSPDRQRSRGEREGGRAPPLAFFVGLSLSLSFPGSGARLSLSCPSFFLLPFFLLPFLSFFLFLPPNFATTQPTSLSLPPALLMPYVSPPPFLPVCSNAAAAAVVG